MDVAGSAIEALGAEANTPCANEDAVAEGMAVAVVDGATEEVRVFEVRAARDDASEVSGVEGSAATVAVEGFVAEDNTVVSCVTGDEETGGVADEVSTLVDGASEEGLTTTDTAIGGFVAEGNAVVGAASEDGTTEDFDVKVVDDAFEELAAEDVAFEGRAVEGLATTDFVIGGFVVGAANEE